MTTSGSSSSAVERKGIASLVPARAQQAVVTMGAFGVLLVVIQVVNMITNYWMVANWGIVPRTAHGLIGIATAPLLQTGWGHLLANIVPLLVFGFLVLAGGARQFVAVTVLVWLISGFGVWLTGSSNTVVVGASGLVFGYLDLSGGPRVLQPQGEPDPDRPGAAGDLGRDLLGAAAGLERHFLAGPPVRCTRWSAGRVPGVQG